MLCYVWISCSALCFGYFHLVFARFFLHFHIAPEPPKAICTRSCFGCKLLCVQLLWVKIVLCPVALGKLCFGWKLLCVQLLWVHTEIAFSPVASSTFFYIELLLMLPMENCFGCNYTLLWVHPKQFMGASKTTFHGNIKSNLPCTRSNWTYSCTLMGKHFNGKATLMGKQLPIWKYPSHCP